MTDGRFDLVIDHLRQVLADDIRGGIVAYPTAEAQEAAHRCHDRRAAQIEEAILVLEMDSTIPV